MTEPDTVCHVGRGCLVPENDPPTFIPMAATITVLEDARPYRSMWATNISPGPEEEAEEQDVNLNASCNNHALFAAGNVRPGSSGMPRFSSSPFGTSTSDLIFTVAANAHGSSRCSVWALDNGGGNSRSAPVQLTIVVTPGETAWCNHIPACISLHTAQLSDAHMVCTRRAGDGSPWKAFLVTSLRRVDNFRNAF
jgi:hypothetical protein